MSWNYRVTRTLTKGRMGEYEYCVREVYYDDAGNVTGWTEYPDYPYGETTDELAHDLAHMVAALRLPVLDIESGEAREVED